ncbi:hypothetical protein MtrunA17_Chr1g0153891 [Medicago truncatula]|uniref:Transmembrane protein, putative n=1 Tax=Medicago truncatula TaxID=3880 RepID=G7I4H4_MEDTR|nr:transmembrane protein, putative [Medicago truncatula]RHN77353.1 hypothetical protein MtrunA17_Chr1g0153891 [Medicago truncatula]
MLAVDAIIGLNSLFTTVTFIGLGWTQNDPSNNVNADPKCISNTSAATCLVIFNGFLFGYFLISNLIVYGLRVVLCLCTATTRRNHILHTCMVVFDVL